MAESLISTFIIQEDPSPTWWAEASNKWPNRTCLPLSAQWQEDAATEHLLNKELGIELTLTLTHSKFGEPILTVTGRGFKDTLYSHPPARIFAGLNISDVDVPPLASFASRCSGCKHEDAGDGDHTLVDVEAELERGGVATTTMCSACSGIFRYHVEYGGP